MSEEHSAPEVGRHYTGELGRRYFDYQQAGIDVASMVGSRLFEPLLGNARTVVDFGCGGGGILSLLDVPEKIGIEPNETARAAARERGVHAVASARDLVAASADVVISNHALEHTMSPVHELRELRRLIRPGGRVVLALPLDDWRTQKQYVPDPNHHLYTWTPLLVGNLLDEAGFAVDDACVVTYALPYYNEILHARLPAATFDRVCRIWSLLRRHRQVLAVGRKAD